jgi:hypothetical protein
VPGPLFFGQDSVRGLADFGIALPHNEIDLGLCSVARANPFPNTTCSAFARYVWSGYLEMQPLRRSPFRRLFVIFGPKLFGGDNIPARKYTAAASPILWELTAGSGLQLPWHLELRYTYHKAFLLGRYSSPVVAESIRTNGPYGRNSLIGVRWSFGERRKTGDTHATSRVILNGFIDFAVSPPHDEVDLGLCLPADGLTCAAYARYVWSGSLQLQPTIRNFLRRLAIFIEPTFFAGNNVPQQHYTADTSPILWEWNAGAALPLSRHFELRFTHHETSPLGRYAGPTSAATLQSNGPYGQNSTLGLRWYFGGWEHAGIGGP